MTKQIVDVLVGDSIEDEAERHVLERLRSDLTRRGISARIYANVFTTGRTPRQVDLLIVTSFRCVQVELKNLDPSLPLELCRGASVGQSDRRFRRSGLRRAETRAPHRRACLPARPKSPDRIDRRGALRRR